MDTTKTFREAVISLSYDSTSLSREAAMLALFADSNYTPSTDNARKAVQRCIDSLDAIDALRAAQQEASK